MYEEKGLRGLFGEHEEEEDLERSPYASMISVPRVGRYMIHRDNVEKFKRDCEKVGMRTSHIGFSSTGKSEKLFASISDKKKYVLVVDENMQRSKTNNRIFKERRESDHTFEGLFLSDKDGQKAKELEEIMREEK